jgi:hypothetical protein
MFAGHARPRHARRVGPRVEFSISRSRSACCFLGFSRFFRNKGARTFRPVSQLGGRGAILAPRPRLAPKSMKPTRTRKKPQNAQFRPDRQKPDALCAPWCPSVESPAVLPLPESPRWHGGGKASGGVRGLWISDPRLVPSLAFRRAGFECLIFPRIGGTDLGTVLFLSFPRPPKNAPLTAGMCLGMVVVDH